jgi:hypothetical protein
MPARPASPDYQVRSLVSWRVVAAAGGVAWLLVGGLTLTIWAANHRSHPVRAAIALPSNDLSERTAVSDATHRIEPTAKPPEAVAASPGEQAPLEQLLSFKKPPASPPLPVEEEERVARQSELPASELSLGEETANCRNYGTQVAFVSSPTEAGRKALKERKLLFVLHLSGNFEDKQFT